MRILFWMTLFLGFNAFAQTQQYQLKGTLAEPKKGQTPIEFTLEWSEAEGIITGVYQDSYYTQKAQAKGIVGELGRLFIVTLPEESKGMRSLTLVTSELKGEKGAALIPVSFIFRDEKGNPIMTASTEANLSGKTAEVVAQRQEDSRCQDGFGSLAGLCGVYSGILTEQDDSKNRCDLLSIKNTKLIFDENGELGLALGETSGLVATPLHRIGRIFTDPDSTNIEVMSRNCRVLEGTSFAVGDCKRLVLEGRFSEVKNKKHFSGSYTIINETTNQTCRYSLSMDREE